jgi:hypothetical protein
MPQAHDDPTLSVPNMRAEFRSANPEVFAKAQGDLDTTRRLGVVELRAEAIKQRFYEHFEKHQDAWTAAEAIRLMNSRSFPTLQHPAPRVFGAQQPRGLHISELMATKARQNVHARAIQRVTNINAIKSNLQNALIRNRPQVTQSQANAQTQTPALASQQATNRTAANDSKQKQGLRNKGP